MNKETATKERRFATDGIEIRAKENGEASRTIHGYAAVFNRASDTLSEGKRSFTEVIAPGAFDDVLNDNTVALFNHDSNQILARSKGGSGTLSIGTDETGLWYTFDMPHTRAGDDLLESIRRGDVESSSFGFSVAKDSWSETRDDSGNRFLTRTISKVAKLYDVSPVVSPAYPDATVALRSLEEFRKETPEPPAPIENHSLSHWQRRTGLINKPAL